MSEGVAYPGPGFYSGSKSMTDLKVPLAFIQPQHSADPS